MNRVEFYTNLENFKEKNALEHHGIKGQHWGTRRWQNADGTFNEAGKERYFGKGKKSSSSDDDTKISGYAADHFHKNIYLRTDKNTLKKIKKYPDIYDTEGLSDDEILKAIRRVPKIPNANTYGRLIREELYQAQINKKKTKYYESNSKENSEEENIEYPTINGKPDKKTEKEAKALKKEAEKFNKEFEKADFIKRQELLKNVINDKRYKPLFDQIDQNDTEKNKDNLKRIEEIFGDYKDKEIEHLATAGIMNMFTNGYYPNPTMEDVANCAWFYAYEDGNQGSNTAEYLYSTIDKGVKAEELVNLYNDLHRHSNIKEEAKATLKENPMLANVDERYLNRMINKKLDDKYSDNTGYWNLYAATEGSGEPTDKQRKDYKEAKKIATKLNSSCGNSNGWDYLNQAIENLDLSDKELKNMTQADWDRINAEINKLKK